MPTTPVREEEYQPGHWSDEANRHTGVFTLGTGQRQIIRVHVQSGRWVTVLQGLSYFGDGWRLVTVLELCHAP